MSNAATALPKEARPRVELAELFRTYGTTLIFVVLVVAATWQSPAFLTLGNILNVLRQVAPTGIMAVGMLFVILTRGIDLSVGSLLALGSVTCATLIVGEHGTVLGVGGAIGAGAAAGLVTGLLVAYAQLPPFVITLAMMTAARGVALIASSGQPILMGDAGDMLTSFGAGFAFGVPLPVLLMFTVFIVAGLVLGFTKFGRLVKAIGSNAEAVRLSGIAAPRYILAVYVISGALAAIAGVISVSRTGVGSGSIGVGAELDVIAAVVIGGASLMGGRGGVVNTLLGALVMGVIGNIMNLADVPGYNQQVAKGLIIVIAMLLQNGTRWLRR